MIRINFAFKSNLTTWKDALVVHNDALNRFLLVIKIITYIMPNFYLPSWPCWDYSHFPHQALHCKPSPSFASWYWKCCSVKGRIVLVWDTNYILAPRFCPTYTFWCASFGCSSISICRRLISRRQWYWCPQCCLCLWSPTYGLCEI